MLLRLWKNNIKKNKTITGITLLFITTAAALISLTAILALNLSGAIDNLMEQSQTPHFMQMHSGDLDTARLSQFAADSPLVSDYQVLEFLNVEGSRFVLVDTSLAASVQDNGLTTQSDRFDYLLDLDGHIIAPADGTIYVPLCYMLDGSVNIGDPVTIYGKTLTAAGFLRDSQMNSLLSSSKRFLVSEADYQELRSLGAVEYLIEFRLHDINDLGQFETAYSQSGLEAGGPMVSFPLFRMINAISDGILIAVILLVSILLMVTAFLCIRFTLLARMEEEYREIGVMKALGLRTADIKRLYLSGYALLAAVGCGAGFLLSFAVKDTLIEPIRLAMGESKYGSYAVFIAAAATFVTFMIIVGFVSHVLRQFRKISPVQAIRFGTAGEQKSRMPRLRLSRFSRVSPNLLLGIQDVFARFRMYLTMIMVLVLAAFILIVPLNLYHTVSADEFIRYKGIGMCDIRFDIQQTDDIETKAAVIADILKQDDAVASCTVLTTKTLTVLTNDGTAENIKVELGDHTVYPIEYPAGQAPETMYEIALSSLNADSLEKTVGDTLILYYGDQELELTVCGIYSDFTNGGKSAKAIFSAPDAPTAWSVIYAALTDPELTQALTARYSETFPYAKVADIQVYMEQQFGATVQSIKLASQISAAIAVLISMLVTLLFMKLLIAKEQPAIAAMKAMGFTGRDITVQFITRSLLVLAVSIIVGTILANTIGESLAGAAMASLGTFAFRFIINPISAYFLCPLMMVCAVLIATLAGTAGAADIHIIQNIKE